MEVGRKSVLLRRRVESQRSALPFDTDTSENHKLHRYILDNIDEIVRLEIQNNDDGCVTKTALRFDFRFETNKSLSFSTR